MVVNISLYAESTLHFRQAAFSSLCGVFLVFWQDLQLGECSKPDRKFVNMSKKHKKHHKTDKPSSEGKYDESNFLKFSNVFSLSIIAPYPECQAMMAFYTPPFDKANGTPGSVFNMTI